MSEPQSATDATMAYQPGEPVPASPVTMAAKAEPLSLPASSSVGAEFTVAGYEIISELGRGGMGVVYKARQIALNRFVALKMILAGKFADETQLKRFQAEAEALAKLQHPNIVNVYDVGSHQGNAYIALELVEGGNLAEKLRSIPQPPRAAARLIELLARAMHSAHEVGIIHRDLKPINILLQPFVLGDARSGSSAGGGKSSQKSMSKSSSRQSIMTHVTVEYGTPKITDFGLAKQEEGISSGLTNAGSIMGTPSYMSPEQALGDVGLIGPATDTYSLGAMLYEMLTGRPPFRADTPVNTIMQVIRGEVVPPSKLVAKLPRDLETITLKCLEKSPSKRYASAQALADDLACYLDDHPISARPVGPIERTMKWMHRRPLVAAMIGLIIMGVLSFIILGTWAYLAVQARAKEAERAGELARAAALESKQRLIRLAVSNGAQFLDRGYLLGGAAWFAEALKLENNHDAEIIHRKRLAAVLARSPILGNLWQHEAAINDIALSPDGTILASGGNDGMLRLWKMSDGKPLLPPIENGSPIVDIDYAPDGRELLVISSDGNCKLWNITDKPVARLVGQGVAQARFLHDGKRLITVGKPGGLIVQHRDTLERMTPLLNNNGAVTDVALAPDREHALLSSRDGNSRYWHLTDGLTSVPPLKQGSPATAVAINHDGKYAATGGENGLVYLWNLKTGELALSKPWHHEGSITKLQFSPNGRWLASASDDKQCIVWDVMTGMQYSPRLSHGSRVSKISFTPDARWIVTLAEDNFARVWDIHNGRLVVSPFRHNGTPQAFQLTANGRGLLTAGQDQLLRYWILPIQIDQATDSVLSRQQALQWTTTQIRLLTSPNGKLAANYGGEQPVRLRDAASREPMSDALKTGGATSALGFSHDSNWVATGGFDGMVQVWSTKDGSPRWSKPGSHTSRVYVVAFHPQGQVLATGSDDNTIRVWNADTGEACYAPIRHESGVFWLTFSKDGKTIFSASLDGSTRVYDAATGEPITPKLPAWNGQPWEDQLVATPLKLEELLTLTQALTGMQVDQQGGMTLLDASAIRERYQKIKGKSEQTDIPADDTAWHDYHASISEKDGDWFAAAWHLEQLSASKKQDISYQSRWANALSKLQDWPRVIETTTALLQTSPANIEAWLMRGQAHGELKNWPASIRDIGMATRLQQQPSWAMVMPALMKWEMGDRTGFELERQKLLQSKVDAEAVAAVMVLSSGKTDEMQTIMQAINDLMAQHPQRTDLQLLHCGLLIRSGQYQKALDSLMLMKVPGEQQSAKLLWQALAMKYLNQDYAKVLQSANTEQTRSLIPQSWPDSLLRQAIMKQMEGK